MCSIEGICLDCADSQSCPMLLAHKEFSGTLKSVMCIAFRPATSVAAVKYSTDVLSSAELIGATFELHD